MVAANNNNNNSNVHNSSQYVTGCMYTCRYRRHFTSLVKRVNARCPFSMTYASSSSTDRPTDRPGQPSSVLPINRPRFQADRSRPCFQGPALLHRLLTQDGWPVEPQSIELEEKMEGGGIWRRQSKWEGINRRRLQRIVDDPAAPFNRTLQVWLPCPLWLTTDFMRRNFAGQSEKSISL